MRGCPVLDGLILVFTVDFGTKTLSPSLTLSVSPSDAHANTQTKKDFP